MNKLCLYSLITSQKEVDLFLKNKDFYFKNIEGVDKFILLNGIEINDELSNCFDNNVSIKKIVSKTKLPLPKAVLYFAERIKNPLLLRIDPGDFIKNLDNFLKYIINPLNSYEDKVLIPLYEEHYLETKNVIDLEKYSKTININDEIVLMDIHGAGCIYPKKIILNFFQDHNAIKQDGHYLTLCTNLEGYKFIFFKNVIYSYAREHSSLSQNIGSIIDNRIINNEKFLENYKSDIFYDSIPLVFWISKNNNRRLDVLKLWLSKWEQTNSQFKNKFKMYVLTNSDNLNLDGLNNNLIIVKDQFINEDSLFKKINNNLNSFLKNTYACVYVNPQFLLSDPKSMYLCTIEMLARGTKCGISLDQDCSLSGEITEDPPQINRKKAIEAYKGGRRTGYISWDIRFTSRDDFFDKSFSTSIAFFHETTSIRNIESLKLIQNIKQDI